MEDEYNFDTEEFLPVTTIGENSSLMFFVYDIYILETIYTRGAFFSINFLLRQKINLCMTCGGIRYILYSQR